jgi:hypothetical protein
MRGASQKVHGNPTESRLASRLREYSKRGMNIKRHTFKPDTLDPGDSLMTAFTGKDTTILTKKSLATQQQYLTQAASSHGKSSTRQSSEPNK